MLQYAFVLTAALTVVGWFVVARQADRREFRKEVREQIKELRDRVEDVRSAAATYWLADTAKVAGPAAVSLKAELARLSRCVIVVSNAGLVFGGPELMAAVRRSATGGDFEKKGRKRAARDLERLVDVVGALGDLVQAVDQAFYELFRPIGPLRTWRYAVFLLPLGLTGDRT